MTPRTVAGALTAMVALVVLGAVWAGGSGGPRPVSLTGSGETFLATADLDRAVTGIVDAEISLRRRDGAATDVETVTVSGAMPAMGHVLAEIPARRAGPDRFHVRGELFSMPGTWELDIRVISTSGTDVIGIEIPVEHEGR
jgi:hypothetical protein